MIRTLIVDDEPLAIERLQILAGQQDGVSLVGTASDGASALRMVDALAPDLVLCDIAMPDLDGLQVAAAIDARMDEVYWGCYAAEQGEMRLQGLEAVLAPELAQLPRGASGDWFAAGTGWGTYGARIALQPCGSEPAMLPHAQDLLSLATFAWARGEALPADQAQPVYLRDNVATPKQPV